MGSSPGWLEVRIARMIHLYRSNRLEELFSALAEVIRDPIGSAIDPETIVVQSRSMEDWLSMELSRRNGICANVDFPFPHTLVKRVYNAIEGREEEDNWLKQGQLLWRLMDRLTSDIGQPEFEEIASYLAEDDSGIKRYQLATNIARLFDTYSHFRPEMVNGWDQTPAENWQASLWHSTITANGITHPAAVERIIREAIESSSIDFGKLPGRLSLFGIPALSPLYLEIFEMVSEHIEVHLFLLSPCRKDWRKDQGASPLLSSMGKTGRDFELLLSEPDTEAADGADHFIEPGKKTVLASLQTDTLDLEKPDGEQEDGPRQKVEPDDQSIGIHSCHSPMREVEVLRDQLLDLLEKDKTLEPKDIGVILPSLPTYAPYIKAVFGSRGTSQANLPYVISDLSASEDAPVVGAFLDVLELASRRVTTEEVLGILESEAVRDRFGMTGSDVETIENWINESGIRWGIDAEHREELGQPAFENNSWRFGLDRMLLGIALPERENVLWEDRLPCHLVEGTASILLGKLSAFCESLFSLHRKLRKNHTPEAWKSSLLQITEDLCSGDGDYAQQQQVLRDSIEKTFTHAAEAGFTGEITLDIIRSLFSEELGKLKTSPGRLGSGITFCPMVPMRSIPFRVVCLLGMNDGEYPASGRAPSFDLTLKDPQPGDITRRDEDRYCFLEAFLSARDKLLITYCGQSDRNDKKRPPSVVVNELIDVLSERFVLPESDAVADECKRRKEWITEHPLQPFSLRYFEPAAAATRGLFSYSAGYCEGARALRSQSIEQEPFFTGPIDEQKMGAGEVIRIEELLRFFKSPAASFIKDRLKIYPGRLRRNLEEREPIELNQLDRYKIGDRILSLLIDELPIEEIQRILGASGLLPPGTPGTLLVDDLANEIHPIAEAIKAIRIEEELEPLPIDQEIGDYRLQGQLGYIYPDALLRFGYSSFRHDRLLRVWIEHLVLCNEPGNHPRKSRFICRSSEGSGAKSLYFEETSEPATYLKELLDLYTLGQSEPLLFFPKSSSAYLKKMQELNDESPEAREKALKAAKDEWVEDEYRKGGNESLEEALRLLFRDASPDPFDENYRDELDLKGRDNSFQSLAEKIFRPLNAHLGESE